jgi:hypothetical protein
MGFLEPDLDITAPRRMNQISPGQRKNGAGLGAVIGGVAGNAGKGAATGATVGAVGAVAQKDKSLNVPSETLLEFLNSPRPFRPDSEATGTLYYGRLH